MKQTKESYFGILREAITTSFTGVKLTFRHIISAVKNKRKDTTTASDENYFKQPDGIVTLNYPYENIPVPDNGRYRLHNEIEDCIVCDKCAKICPVNCIEIEAVKATEQIGTTSDGTPVRLYAARFDIDMAKCCYCGLCTTVCPTECLTMTKSYDFSEFDVRDMIYHFSNLTPDEAVEKQKVYEEHQQAKKEAQPKAEPKTVEQTTAEKPRPVFKSRVKSPAVADETTAENPGIENNSVENPEVKVPVAENVQPEENNNPENQDHPQNHDPKPVKQKAVFQARMKTPAQKQETPQETENPAIENVQPEENNNPENQANPENPDPKPVKQKAVFQARMKTPAQKQETPPDTENPVVENAQPKENKNTENQESSENPDPKPVKQRAVFKARVKPVQGKDDEPVNE